VFVRRSRVPLAVVLVGAAAVLATGCAGPPPVPASVASSATPSSAASFDGTDLTGLSPDDRWWWAVEVQTRECMAGNGYPEYRLTPPWSREPGARSADEWLAALPIEKRDAAHDALLGAADSAPDPTWRDTGCAGRAIHDAGAD